MYEYAAEPADGCFLRIDSSTRCVVRLSKCVKTRVRRTVQKKTGYPVCSERVYKLIGQWKKPDLLNVSPNRDRTDPLYRVPKSDL